MKNEMILIVGGYGKVGQVISETLCKLFENRVIVAGRNYQKAKEFAEKLDNLVAPMEFDIDFFSKNDNRFDDIKLVVTCIDQNNTKFVEWCFEKGIDYIDVTASYEFLSKVEALNDKARKSGTTAILSVGLAPGITNLLAKVCKLRGSNIQFLDIFIMLGMGETHGDEAIRWMLDNINSDFSVIDKNQIKRVGSFKGKKRTIFPNETQERTAYRFNFSDQHVIPKTLQISSVSTYICLDSVGITWVLYLFRKIGLSNLLKIKAVKEAFLKLLKTFSYGSEEFAVMVSAGIDYEKSYVYEVSVLGTGEARMTGLVAAKVAARLFTSPILSGVFHIEELFDPLEFINSLDGLRFKELELITFR